MTHNANREAGMRNSTRKTILLGVIVSLIVIALRMFGLLGGPPVAYSI